LLKLVQRNQWSTPSKEIYLRWNVFCDVSGPPPQDGARPTRDPKLLSRELIRRFLVEELPATFWVFLLKKIQAESRDSGLAEMWTDFCDRHAPRLPGDSSRAVRDPRHLEPDFLLSFIATALEGDDQSGGNLATIIDAYAFDFSNPGPARKGDKFVKEEYRDIGF